MGLASLGRRDEDDYGNAPAVDRLGSLALIGVDRFGTPNQKLPRCPGCGEDELWSAAPDRTDRTRRFSCYCCRFQLEIPGGVNG